MIKKRGKYRKKGIIKEEDRSSRNEEKGINQVDCEWYIAYFSEASLDNSCAFIINYIQTFYQRIAS